MAIELDSSHAVRNYTKWILATARRGAGLEFSTQAAALASIPGTEHLQQKAAVTATTTGNAAGIVGEARAWLAIMSRRSVLGQLGALPAPPHVTVPTPATTDPVPTWAIEGAPLPLARISFTDPQTSISKFGFLQAFTRVSLSGCLTIAR